MLTQQYMLAWYMFDFQGIRTSIAMRPYIFVIFQEWGSDPCPHPLWILAWKSNTVKKKVMHLMAEKLQKLRQ